MLVFDALQQALIFIPLTLGLYLTYQILAITDLTPDGSFVLGAALFARFVTTGFSPLMAMLIAIGGGILAGAIVCAMQRVGKINSLIASILAVFMLYSVNFAILGQPNISLLDIHTFLSTTQSTGLTLILLVIMGLIFTGFFLLLRSNTGLYLRAFGKNEKLLRNLGKPSVLYLLLGLCLANGLAAFCGVITAQINGYADINMGMGVALTGIGAVVIGCQLMRTLFIKSSAYSLLFDIIGCFLGTYLYFLLVNFFLYLNINPIYLKLILGIVLTLFLSLAHYSSKYHRIAHD
jgi:putative ABC transport system permease protein